MENGNKVRMCCKLWHHCSVVLSVQSLHVGDTSFLSRGNQRIVGVSNYTSLELHFKDQIWEWISLDLQAWFSVIVMKMYHDFVSLFCSLFVFCLFLSQLWAGDAEELRNQDTSSVAIPFSSFLCRCVLELCDRRRATDDHSLQLPACLGFF